MCVWGGGGLYRYRIFQYCLFVYWEPAINVDMANASSRFSDIGGQ